MVVVEGKMEAIFEAILGVWEVPPDSMTSSISSTSSPAFLTTPSIKRLKPSKTFLAIVS